VPVRIAHLRPTRFSSGGRSPWSFGTADSVAPMDSSKGTASYYDLLKHPLWQAKRLKVMELAGFECEHDAAREEFTGSTHGELTTWSEG